MTVKRHCNILIQPRTTVIDNSYKPSYVVHALHLIELKPVNFAQPVNFEKIFKI